MSEDKINKLQKVNIPDIIDIGGQITQEEGYVSFEKNTYTGEIRFGKLNITLSVDAVISGVPISFKSHISHQFTANEMNELMTEFKKTN
jgi:hypothetical protein